MWFTRQQDGFRGWFIAEQGNGTLRGGLLAGDFVVTVVDPADSANTSPAVAESSQLAGLYTFLVSSSFVTTNGVGNYGVAVQIDTKAGPSGAPHVVGTMSSVLSVTEESLAGLALLRYGGAVYIDVAGGTAGTAYGIGTEEQPSDNVADALTIANANGIRKFKVRGSIILPSALPDWQFEGNGEEAEVNLNGQDVADSEFANLVLTGSVGTGPVRLTRVELDGVGGLSGTGSDCSLRAGVVDITGDFRFEGLYSAVAGVTTGALNCGAAMNRVPGEAPRMAARSIGRRQICTGTSAAAGRSSASSPTT